MNYANNRLTARSSRFAKLSTDLLPPVWIPGQIAHGF